MGRSSSNSGFSSEGGYPPAQQQLPQVPGEGTPPRYCSGQGASTLLQRLQQQLALLPGEGTPPRGCCSSEGGYPPRAAAIASAFRPGGGYPPSLLQQQRGGYPAPLAQPDIVGIDSNDFSRKRHKTIRFMNFGKIFGPIFAFLGCGEAGIVQTLP